MQLEKQRTVSASYIGTLLNAFSEVQGGGVSREAVLSEAGLESVDLQDPDARLPVETVSKLWIAARSRTNDRLIGLRVGRFIRPGSFSVLGHLLMTCATLREALDQAAKFAVLVGDGGLLTVKEQDGSIVLTYDLVDPFAPCREERIEAILASLVSFADWITGTEINPIEVSFTHKAPKEITEFKKVFGLSPRFAQGHNTLVFGPEDLSRPLTQANAALSSVLTNHAESILTQLTAMDPFLYRLRQHLLAQLPSGVPNLEDTAFDLGIPPRSLQRKLSANDTTFKKELSQIRRDTAFQYLNSNTPIIEIAFLLGFSDTASFHKAFKRWTGDTPGNWRSKK